MPRALALTFILLLLSACGYKGPPQPLGLPLPAAPPAFEVVQRGEELLLAWTLPAANQDQTPLRDLAGFRIYRMRFDPAEDCPECRDTSTLWESVDLDYLRSARRIGDRLFLLDEDVEIGAGYQYRVVPVTAAGREGKGAVARRPVLSPPPAPQNLAATPQDQFVRLSWEPPAQGDEESLLGYNVYRRVEGAPPPLLPVNDRPLALPYFEDFGLENGLTYLYTLRAVGRSEDQQVESRAAGPVEATPAPGK